MSEQFEAVVVRSHGGPEVLESVRREVRSPGPGEVRVAVRSIGTNFRDVQQRRLPAAGAEPPFVPGSDFAGDVVEVGSDVVSLRPGDAVVGVTMAGAYAEQVVTAASAVFKLPEGVDYDTGAILPVAGLSASFLVSGALLDEGATAVTYAAAGGLGCFLGGLLAASGVRSIGLTSTAEKAEVARRAGHSDIVLYRDVDPVAAVHDLTDGRGVDVVFDSVGGPDFGRSFRMARNEGMVVLCGRAAGEPDLGEVVGDFIGARRNLTLREFFLGTYIFDHFNELPRRIIGLLDAVRDGVVQVPVTVLPLAEARRAHELLESGTTVGKVVLRP